MYVVILLDELNFFFTIFFFQTVHSTFVSRIKRKYHVSEKKVERDLRLRIIFAFQYLAYMSMSQGC